MAVCKKLTFGVCAAMMCISAGHGETFREKVDRVFLDHAQEIGERIKAWNDFNSNKPDYIITEKELKDVVLRAREEAVRYMQQCLEYQVAFFDYFKTHRREGCTEFLKKRFDAEQNRIRALLDLESMIEEFKPKGINCEPLVCWKKIVDSWKPDPNDPGDLYRKIIAYDMITEKCGDFHEAWHQTAQNFRVDQRVRNFFSETLFDGSELHWIKMPNISNVVRVFRRGYFLYTKCNVSREKWEGRCGAPAYCLYEVAGDKGICDDIFKSDELVWLYGAVEELVQMYIRSACDLCVLLEKFFGTKEKPSENVMSFMLNQFYDFQDLRYTIVRALTGTAFETVADAVVGVYDYIEELYPSEYM